MNKPRGFENCKQLCNSFKLFGRSGYGEVAEALYAAYKLGKSEPVKQDKNSNDNLKENLGIKKPDICCDIGTFSCQGIDFCISHIVAALNAGGVETVASCCGHGKQDGSIVLKSGEELIIKKRD